MPATQRPKSVAANLLEGPSNEPQGAELEAKIHLWRLSRREVRELKNHLGETGSLHCAELLLRHSIAFGHGRLLVRRYLLTCALGLVKRDLYEPYFLKASGHLPAGELARTRVEIEQLAARLLRIRVGRASAACSDRLDGREAESSPA